jgi:hypothetical protein
MAGHLDVVLLLKFFQLASFFFQLFFFLPLRFPAAARSVSRVSHFAFRKGAIGPHSVHSWSRPWPLANPFHSVCVIL